MHYPRLVAAVALAAVLTGCGGDPTPVAPSAATASPDAPHTGLDPALPPVPSSPVLPSAAAVVPPGVPFAGNLLVVRDQAGPGTDVSVDQAASGEPGGFVVVHADEGGRLGTFLGSVPVAAGPGRNYVVPLAKPLPRSTSLQVALHRDADGDGRFDQNGDDPVVTPDGPLIFLVRYTLER